MRYFLLLLALAANCQIIAQTKKIAFKSHSGSRENFQIALAAELFDMNGSNFGQAPNREIFEAKLDSVIFISENETKLITSRHCTPRYAPKSKSSVWQPGIEYAIRHPLFSKQHALDSIKKVLATQYNFRNRISEVVFIGFDNKPPKDENNKDKYFAVPGATTGIHPPGDSPIDGEFFLIMLFAVVLPAGVAGILWLSLRKKEGNSLLASVSC